MLGASLGVLALAGCKTDASNTGNPGDAGTAAADPNADPAAANMAPVDDQTTATAAAPASVAASPTRVKGYQQQAQPTQEGQAYSAPAPIERSNGAQNYSDQGNYENGSGNDNYDDAAEAGYQATLTDEYATEPPPPLPQYEQPEAPDPNALWTPGYWNYGSGGYYWVPGAWVQAPYTGALWTPGYWAFVSNRYRFHRGFWGPHIGFYGGINYGFGYTGRGYEGGYWNGDNFYYNRAVNRVNNNIRNTYVRNVTINNTVINNRTVNNTVINNVSYNGGNGGVQARPRPAEIAVLREQRVPPMQAQIQHQQQAAQNRQQFYSANKGRPVVVAAPRVLAADRGITPPLRTTAQIPRTPAGIPQQQARPVTPPVQNRPAVQPGQPGPVRVNPATQNRSGQPVARPAEVNRPTPVNAGRPNPVQSNERPGQVNRPGQPNQPTRPAEAARPAQPTTRPSPNRPVQQAAPQPARPQPQVQSRPQQHIQSRPQSESRPQPQVQNRPQPQARPETQAAPRPAIQQPQPQQARPQPQQQARPQPQQQQARPQSQPRPAQQPHPQAKPEAHR